MMGPASQTHRPLQRLRAEGAAVASRFERLRALLDRIAQQEEGVWGEILDGALELMARPGGPHQHAVLGLADWGLRGDGPRGKGSWWFELERELLLPAGRLVVPDLAAWRTDSGRPPLDVVEANPIERLPQWCCEVLSPGAEARDRDRKLPLYAEVGIPWCWLLDPQQRCVEVYRSQQGRPVLHARATTGTPVLPPFETPLPIDTLWVPTEQR